MRESLVFLEKGENCRIITCQNLKIFPDGKRHLHIVLVIMNFCTDRSLFNLLFFINGDIWLTRVFKRVESHLMGSCAGVHDVSLMICDIEGIVSEWSRCRDLKQGE